jgi:hypothetical protein
MDVALREKSVQSTNISNAWSNTDTVHCY